VIVLVVSDDRAEKVANVIEAFHELYPEAECYTWSRFVETLGLRITMYHVTVPHGFIVNHMIVVDERNVIGWSFDWRT
jgi:hypothetical protein